MKEVELVPEFIFDLRSHYGEEITTVVEQLLNDMVLHYNTYIVGNYNKEVSDGKDI